MTVDSYTSKVEAYNRDVKSWAQRIGSGLKGNIMAFSNKGDGTLSAGLVTRTRKSYGAIDRITYQFPRHGVFLQKGVGRGYMMEGGTVVRGIKKSKHPRLLTGAINRQPEDWFNGTLLQEVPKLADIVADHNANQVVSEIDRMLIR